MIKKLFGYILGGVGFIGVIFFDRYHGEVIPLPWLWLIIFTLIGLLGLLFIITANPKKNLKQKKYDRERLERLKTTGEAILMTNENCDIKENNYYEEVDNGYGLRVQAVDALYDPNENYKQDFIEQSAIIYFYGNEKYRMTSETYLFNGDTLKTYIEDKLITLYVNRFKKEDYLFELKSNLK